ncbi:isopentenyl-diphosphate Delta-isomerase [Glycomyces sp. A-F 0318]|uniref:isopentenyl-diphosphate Delta-isomerase n=1 Tax=Glycomyces amatae TaxID=2881355 RepID=UPI001E348707|nr:isopentenyl-diphosphate Delta-isomerase [Glycomyces amatae]MCD0443173.1 isopentenyl-diphosphate Delta-isomerase [Glycomyces amatae]
MADDVVLLDTAGRPAGTAPKASVHHRATPLHLAFSCHVTDADGAVLVTRRSLSKAAWPGVWTNSFCGHPRPDEAFEHAVVRHAEHELGLRLTAIAPVIPDFRYRAVDAGGVVENEVCPVYTAVADGPVRPDPGEVMEFAWVAPSDLAAAIASAPWAFSPWLVLQAVHLDFLTMQRRPK